MEYVLNKEALTTAEVVYDGCQEQPVDLDFSLPDYCPDIQRILKCQVVPCIHSRNFNGDSLEIEGRAAVRVLYLDPSGTGIRCCENTRAFSCSIALRQPAAGAVADAYARVEYVNCRATSPRRLDIHGAFSVCARVVKPSVCEFACGIEGEDVQQRKRAVRTSRAAGFCQQVFPLAETLEIGGGKPPAETVLRTGLTVSAQDHKVVADKLIVKGEACLKVLYAAGLDAPEPEVMEYLIPYSQMLDCGGVTEQCLCDISLRVMDVSVEPKADPSGENTLLQLEAHVSAVVEAYEEAEVEMVTDAYSTRYELVMEEKKRPVDALLEVDSGYAAQKAVFDVGEGGISRVLDLWNEVGAVSAEAGNGQLDYEGKINLCLLAADLNGTPFYLERMVDFSAQRDLRRPAEGRLRCAAGLRVANLSYRITGANSLEVKADLELKAAVYRRDSFSILTQVSADEERPRGKDPAAALTLYYADEGESVWDIARAYCTSVEAVMEENELSGETVGARGMLLIPM